MRHKHGLLFALMLMAYTSFSAPSAAALNLQSFIQMGQLPSLSSLTSGGMAGGIITSCPSCTQANYIQWVRQMMMLMSQIREEYYQLISLKQILYANGESDLNLLSDLSSGGVRTRNALMTLMEDLQTGHYGVQTLTDNYNQIRLRHQLMGARLQSLVQMLQKQHEQSFKDARTLEKTQRQAQHTIGLHQAVQVNNAFAGQNAASLQKIQKIAAAHSHIQATYLTTIEDKKARDEDAVTQFRGIKPLFVERGDDY